METDDKRVVDLITTWNKLVGNLLEAKKLWGEYKNLMSMSIDLTRLGYRAQKVMTLVPWKSTFEVALPRFIDTWRRSGGLEEFVIKEEVKMKKEKKEEKNDGGK